jgi:ribonuclease-3
MGPTDADLVDLARRLGHEFDNLSLLRRALTHRSWCAEHPGEESNERLEFLGDAVLGLVVADHLYRDNPGLAEGQMAPARAQVVSAAALGDVATEIGLGAGLLVGRGEERSGGREKHSILADALEAVIGAVWIDAGLDAADAFVMGFMADRLRAAAAGPGGSDYKTRLQEEAARRIDTTPEYRLTGEGPDHAKVFTATVLLAGEQWGAGTGRTKKEAEQAAAADALARLAASMGDRVEGGERQDA